MSKPSAFNKPKPIIYSIESFDKIPDVAGEIRAWRGWNFGRKRLESVFFSPSIWEPRKSIKAVCKYNDDDPHGRVPDEYCTCGVYALKLLPESRYRIRGWILGEVLLWGKVIETSDGYRAEYGKVACLWKQGGFFRSMIIRHMAKLYNVPVVPAPLWAPLSRNWMFQTLPILIYITLFGGVAALDILTNDWWGAAWQIAIGIGSWHLGKFLRKKLV